MAKFNQAPESKNDEAKIAKWKVGKDPAKIAAIEAKRTAHKDKRAQSIAKVIAFAKSYGDAEIVSAVQSLFPVSFAGGRLAREKGASTGRVTSAAFLLSLFPEGVGSSVSEASIFERFQLGRQEMRNHINRAIKQAKEPKDRLWVQFDFGSKSYVFKSTGADAPDGWVGYRPASVDGKEVL